MKKKIVVALIALLAIFSIGSLTASLYVARVSKELGRLGELHEIENLRRGLVTSVQTVQADLYTARTFLHAQKLESLGTLSAGIAHEFNNLLQVV